MYPLVQEIPYACPNSIFKKLKNLPYANLLHSGQQVDNFGEYSFIGVDPFLTCSGKNNSFFINNKFFNSNPFECLNHILKKFQIKNIPELAPFQCGLIGFLSYELLHHIEPQIKKKQLDDLKLPDIQLYAYDLVIAFSHVKKSAWIFSSGLPETNVSKIALRAKKRLQWLIGKLNKFSAAVEDDKRFAISSIQSNFSKQEYICAVKKFQQYIYEGDIFEANLSQRFTTTVHEKVDPFSLFEQMCIQNPADFSAFIQCDNTNIISLSPERFIRLQNKQVDTYPIKGTSKRSANHQQDKQLIVTLKNSEKDIAENIMIVDLMRNDLSKVCKAHSVKVPYMCEVQSCPTLHHLVSKITGTLKNELTAVSLIEATFPGGSISGAPKPRALEIINEIEPNVRGVYCGSIGYIGFDDTMDFNIAIRTLTITDNNISFNAGGAITLDSIPKNEYDESILKANIFIKLLQQYSNTNCDV